MASHPSRRRMADALDSLSLASGQQRAAAALREAGAGSVIVNISSGAALTPAPPLATTLLPRPRSTPTVKRSLPSSHRPESADHDRARQRPHPGADAIRQNFADSMGVSLADTTTASPGRPETRETSPRPSPTSPRPGAVVTSQPDRRRRRIPASSFAGLPSVGRVRCRVQAHHTRRLRDQLDREHNNHSKAGDSVLGLAEHHTRYWA